MLTQGDFMGPHFHLKTHARKSSHELSTHSLCLVTLEVGIYAPRESDPQTPHTRDELYVVMRGSGWFRNGDDRVAFGPGDVLFVPAHRPHRFEQFTDDLAVWVIFYGPMGGEVGARI